MEWCISLPVPWAANEMVTEEIFMFALFSRTKSVCCHVGFYNKTSALAVGKLLHGIVLIIGTKSIFCTNKLNKLLLYQFFFQICSVIFK